MTDGVKDAIHEMAKGLHNYLQFKIGNMSCYICAEYVDCKFLYFRHRRGKNSSSTKRKYYSR